MVKKKKKCYTVEEALHMFQNIDEAESKDDWDSESEQEQTLPSEQRPHSKSLQGIISLE